MKALVLALTLASVSVGMVGCSSVDYKRLDDGDVVSVNPKANEGLDMVRYKDTYVAQGGEAYIKIGELNRNADLNQFVNPDTGTKGAEFATFHRSPELKDLPESKSSVK